MKYRIHRHTQRLMVIYLRVPHSGQQHGSHSQNLSACKVLNQWKCPHITSTLSQHSPANYNQLSMSNSRLRSYCVNYSEEMEDWTLWNPVFLSKKQCIVTLWKKVTCHMPLHWLLCCETFCQLDLWWTSFTFFMIGTYVNVHRTGLHFLRPCTWNQRKIHANFNT